MASVEQYFSQLAACLSFLPDSERQAVLDYHREYAAEAGLETMEQLTEHFGTPQQLADRLSEELHARRTGSDDDTGSAAQSLNEAVQNLLHSLFGSSQSSRQQAADWSDRPLSPFCNVDLQVTAADVRFVEGDHYGVRCLLPSGEELETLEVRGDTLYLKTRGRGIWSSRKVTVFWSDGDSSHQTPFHGVELVIPRDANLNRLDLKTVSGDLVLQDRTCVDLVVRTTSGDGDFRQVDCTLANMNTVSGDLQLTTFGCDRVFLTTVSGDVTCRDMAANSADIRTVSGDVVCDAETDNLTVQTTSGDCRLTAKAKGALKGTTVSGDLQVIAPDASVQAKTVSGNVTCNGSRARALSQDGSGCRLTLNSISGNIQITR